jgi:FG-GAP-like repeat
MRRRSLILGGCLVAAVALGVPVSASASDFQFKTTNYAVPAGGPTDIEVGDLDGANGLDIVMATFVNGGNPDARVVRYLNAGGGSFGTGAATNSCNSGYDLLVYNFSPGSDSNLDALVNCGFLLGDGAGGFAAPTPTGSTYLADTLTLAELTASGNPEVVFGGNAGATTRVICFASWNSPNLSNEGCGNPNAPNPPFGHQPALFPSVRYSNSPGLETVALDNEPAGDPARDDIFSASTTADDRFQVYERDPSLAVGGTSYAYQAWSDSDRTTSAGSITGIDGGDLNGDGRDDVVVAHGIDANPHFDAFIWDAATGIPPGTQPVQTPSIMRPEEIEIADFDGDGKGDVVQANGIGQVAVHKGNGDGTFGPAEIFALPGGNVNVVMAVADFSGDGLPDIAVGERGVGTGSLSVLINGLTPPVQPPPPSTGDKEAPETKIVKAPKDKFSKEKAKYKFTANEPATFECKFDSKPLKSCTSPTKYGVDEGKHKFSVVATDTAGNVDPTPAKDKFKVVDK